jgi:hypothetical protein
LPAAAFAAKCSKTPSVVKTEKSLADVNFVQHSLIQNDGLFSVVIIKRKIHAHARQDVIQGIFELPAMAVKRKL